MKTVIIAVILSSLSINSWAMRCGNHLISEGSSEAEVAQYCGDPSSTYSDAWGDKKSASYKNGGATETVNILNGRVVSTDLNRF